MDACLSFSEAKTTELFVINNYIVILATTSEYEIQYEHVRVDIRNLFLFRLREIDTKY